MSAINDRFAIVPIEALMDDALTPAEFRVLAVLYSFRDKNANTVWPRQEKIAERARYSDVTQVSKMTTRLENKGWLSKRKKTGPRGSKVYELKVPDRLQLGRKGQVDYTRQVDGGEGAISHPKTQVGQSPQVDNPDPENGGQKTQVDDYAQLDNSDPSDDANLGKPPNCQLGQTTQVLGNQTISIKPSNSSDSDSYESGAGAPCLVDNSLGALERAYQSDNPSREIVNTAVAYLAEFDVPQQSARGLIGKHLKDYGDARVIDALMLTMIYEPADPKAWLTEVLQRNARRTPMPHDFEPPEEWVANAIAPLDLGGLGIPLDIIQAAKDTFVLWFRGQGIQHHDWDGLFRRWCKQDWERAERNRGRYLQRLATASGYGEFVHFQS